MQDVITLVTDLVSRQCDPDRIILFGSHAKGRATLRSDIDLLVVGPFAGRQATVQREVQEVLHRLAIRVDVLVMTPDELAAKAAKPNGFIASILSSGRCLYRRTET